MAHITIDAADVVALATPAVRKIMGKGNVVYTFRAPSGLTKHRKALKHETADELGQIAVTPAQKLADALSAQIVRPTPAYTPRRHPDTVVPIGAWVRITRDTFETRPSGSQTRIAERSAATGEIGQVWSHGPHARTVWVAMGGTRYVVAEASTLEVLGGAESTADALWEDAPAAEPVDVTADAVALAERAEATGRDGVAFVRDAMGDAAADAVTAHRVAQLPTVHPAPIGPAEPPVRRCQGCAARLQPYSGVWCPTCAPAPAALAAPVEPAERVVTTTVCAECGTDVDATGVDASGDTDCPRFPQHMPACDGPADLPVGGAATWHGIDASLTVEAHTVVHGIAATRVRGATGTPTWTRTDTLTSVAHAAWTFHDAMHTLRRNHRRLAQWRTACAAV